MTAYQRLLLAVLAGAAMFQAYCISAVTVVLPHLQDAFGASPDVLGSVLSMVAMGGLATIFVSRYADRFGRKPIYLLATLALSLSSLATIFVDSLAALVAAQFLARLSLATALVAAHTLLAEEMPPAARGRAIGAMTALSAVGSALPAALLQSVESLGWGWRGLFVVPALPLLALPFLTGLLRESGAFLARRKADAAVAQATLLDQLKILAAPRHRRRVLLVSAIFVVLNVWAGSAMYFFYFYARQERGWTSADLQMLAPIVIVCTIAGYLGAGQLMDRLGRRAAALGLLLAGTAATVACYLAEGFWVVAAAWILVQMTQGVWPVLIVMTAELFPTEIRASANSLCQNLIGRLGQIAAPATVGVLAAGLGGWGLGAAGPGGTGLAVALLALVNLAAVPLLLAVPETRGKDLART